MKRLIFILTILMVTFTSIKAQFAVVDASNIAQSKLINSKLLDQSKILSDQRSKLDESLDLMRKVNNTVRNALTVKELIQRNINLTQSCMDLLKDLDGLDTGMLVTISSCVETIMANNANLLSTSQTILSNDLKMSDYERLTFITNLEERTRKEQEKLSVCRQTVQITQENNRIFKRIIGE